MNSTFYFLAEHYPFWGIPLALITAEAANHFRRNGKRLYMVFFALTSLVLISLAVVYFLGDGYSNTRSTLQNVEKDYLKR